MTMSDRFMEKWHEQTDKYTSSSAPFHFSCDGLSCMECAFRYTDCGRSRTKDEWETLMRQRQKCEFNICDEIVSTVSPEAPELVSTIHITENSITIDTPTHTYTEKDLPTLAKATEYKQYLITYSTPAPENRVYTVYISAISPTQAEDKFKSWSLGKGAKILSVKEGVYNS